MKRKQFWRAVMLTAAVTLSAAAVAIAGSRISGTAFDGGGSAHKISVIEDFDGKPDLVSTNVGSNANPLPEHVAETVPSRVSNAVVASRSVAAGGSSHDGKLNIAVADLNPDGKEMSAAAVDQTIVIGFDQDASGVDIPHLTLIDEQYAALGVHFSGVFYTGRRIIAFPTYTTNSSLNLLCTFFGTAGGGNPNCLVPIGGVTARLVVDLDFTVDFASIEGRTRDDGVFDGDGLIIDAFDVAGNFLARGEDFCNNNPPPHTTEGVCVAAVGAPGIRRLVVNPRDTDALDNLTLRISDVPDPPIANSQLVTTTEDTPVAITLTGSDPEGSPLTFTVLTLPANGTLSGSGANRTYTPNPNYNGPDSFTFKVNDGALDSNVATISIDVTPVNDLPTADSQTVSACALPSTPITLTGSDPVEGSPLTFIIVNLPTGGSLSGNAPNVVYTPNASFNISDTFTFKVNDGASDSNIATVTLIDLTPPSLTVAGPSGWINVDGLVTATTSDICDAAPAVTFFNPDPASVQRTGNTAVARYVDEGFYLDVTARSVDDSGNATEAPAPDFAIDRTPPGHNYAGIPPELSAVDDLPLAFDAMDLTSPAVSGLSSVQVILDGSVTLLSKTYPSLGLLVPGPIQDAVACDHATLCIAGALDLGQLALGEHDIRIVVTDMAGNVSETSYHFNLRPLIVLDFKFNPRVLNLKSQGQFVSVEFCVPDGLSVTAADVDPATVFLVDPFGNQYPLDPSGPFDVRGNCFHFKVDRQSLTAGLLAGLGWTPGGDGNEAELTLGVIGEFFSTGGNAGGSFAGEGTVRVINPGGGGGPP